MNEFLYIEKYFAPLSNNNNSLNLKDDIAILDNDIVTSKDLLISGTHFFFQDDPRLLAHKAMNINLSDIASTGGTPISYMLAISLPRNNFNHNDWLEKFTFGLKEVQKQYNIFLLGGDTTSNNDSIIISVTIFAKASKIMKRSNAKINQDIYVSNNIGDSFLGLQILQNNISNFNQNEYDYLINKYYKPEAQIELGKKIIQYSSCCIDISDGLLQDVQHICKNSNVQADIDIDNIPISINAKNIIAKNNINIVDIITGGDDYQLLFTIDNSHNIDYLVNNFKITKIGKTKLKESNNYINIYQSGELININNNLGYKHI